MRHLTLLSKFIFLWWSGTATSFIFRKEHAIKRGANLAIHHQSQSPSRLSMSTLPTEQNYATEEDKMTELANITIDEAKFMPQAPLLSYEKFVTMQEKRVVVTIRYSEESNLKPYFLTVVKKLKTSHPDVIIERRILPRVESGSGEEIFEVLVDGRVVIGKGKARKQKVARVDMSHARSVFVSMQEIDLAISRARRRRRPSTTYGEDDDFLPQMRKAKPKPWKD